MRIKVTALLGFVLGSGAVFGQPAGPTAGVRNFQGIPSWVSDIAGHAGDPTYNGDDVPALSSGANLPGTGSSELAGVRTDRGGNVYFADAGGSRIRMIEAGTGIVRLIAGTGVFGYNGDNRDPKTAQINDPNGIAIDSIGNIYFSERGGHRIRMISNDRTNIITIAGTGTGGYNGSVAGVAASTALVRFPEGITVDAAGTVYFADTGNAMVRKISGGRVFDIAGTGTGGYNGDGIAATSAQLLIPTDVAVDKSGNFYIAEYSGQRIRKVTGGVISTIAGNGTGGNCASGTVASSCAVNFPQGLALNAAGDLIFSDSGNNQLKLISAGTMRTLAGNGTAGYTGPNNFDPQLRAPSGVDVDAAGRIRFADSGNYVIRLWRGETPLLMQLTDNRTGYFMRYTYTGSGASRFLGYRALAYGADPDQVIVGSGDFNGDGNLDLLFEHRITHQATIWYEAGPFDTGIYGPADSTDGHCPCTIGARPLQLGGSPRWVIRAIGDYNNDGHPDLLYQNLDDGRISIWMMTGSFGDQPLQLVNLPGTNNFPWVVMGTADFDGNGVQDILFQNPNTRQVQVWYMSGALNNVFTRFNFPSLQTPGWTVAGAKDFDGDGTPDIFFQNDASAQLLVYLMRGTDGSVNGPVVGLEYGPPTNWRFVAR